MPIHLRAEPGDYADACLLPGDPLRAQYIAETYFDDAKQVNAERGLLGYTGTWDGKPVSVQGTGMGCPGATIVFEELIQLGVKRLLRVGTCGGLQADHALGDLIVAISAVPADATATHLVGGEPHCPTASWELVHEAVHVAKHADEPYRVGPIVSSDLFYNPDEGQYERWSKRGILASRWRPPRCSRSRRCAACTAAACSRSATSSSRASSSASRTRSCAQPSTA
jgi:5'-methylthioadenosine phosphorylase/purine-nucleoside phosphorylase